MGKILMINGSPRAPRSNSKQYAELFAAACPAETTYIPISKTNHQELYRAIEGHSDLLFVFPLYVDGLPVPLLQFLKGLEEHPPAHRPCVSVLINCGFLEPEQNEVAVRMIRLFCSQNGYPFGSVLKIGGGEAILSTPFGGFARRKIKKLARGIAAGRHQNMRVTMPLPKGMFIKASTNYWKNYGQRNGVTPEQMATMEIEATSES